MNEKREILGRKRGLSRQSHRQSNDRERKQELASVDRPGGGEGASENKPSPRKQREQRAGGWIDHGAERHRSPQPILEGQSRAHKSDQRGGQDPVSGASAPALDQQQQSQG